MACASDRTIEEQRDLHNATVKFTRSLTKDIEKQLAGSEKTKADIADLVDMVLKENNIPKLLNESNKAHVLYRTNTANNSKSSVDVYAINAFKGGYKILYTTPGTNTAKIVRVASTGQTHNARYDIDNLKATYEKIGTPEPVVKDTKTPSYHQSVMSFDAFGGNTKIEINKENTDIISAELINDMSKAESVLKSIMEIDGVKVSESHKELLVDTLHGLTDLNKKIIPDMIQTINKEATQNYGKMIMKGKEKGVYIGISSGAQIAGNAMSASEMYVHELLHTALEYAQRDKREIIVNTMNDIEHIYESFLALVTEEDFMPALSESIDRDAERKIAKDRIAYLRNEKTGINEFIVMSQTNEAVKKVLEDKIIVGKTKKQGKTLFQKLIALIQNVYDSVYIVVRGDSKNLGGYTAMTKYIKEISAVNNVALEDIRNQNGFIHALNSAMDFMNEKGSKYIKSALGSLTKISGTKEGKSFEDELAYFMANEKEFGTIKKSMFFFKMLGKWLLDNSEHNVGAFETWLEIHGMKPEGTVQQLIRVLRNSDNLETLVENLGLQSNRIEYKVETSLAQQSRLIKALFDIKVDEKIDESISIPLTKGVLDIELDSMINKQLGGSTKEQIVLLKKVLGDSKELNNEINIMKATIRNIIKNEDESEFIINQSINLGKYMVTGKAGSGQLMNSFMIYGLSGLDMSISAKDSKNERGDAKSNRAFIDKLATLEGIKNTSNEVNLKVLELLNTNENAVISIMNYDTNAREQLKVANGDKFNLSYVKGYHEKVSKANWITPRVDLTSSKERLLLENYKVSTVPTFNKEYTVYLNTDFTEPGYSAEGVKITNDGHKINSYLNIIKENSLGENKDVLDPKEIIRNRNLVKAKLDEVASEVSLEFKKMQKKDYKPSNSGMRPVFAIGKNGEIFVTDMDISVDKQMLENQTRMNNSVDVVLGKTYSRAIDLKESRENNLKILDLAQKDMYDNYDSTKDYFAGGNKNLMSYVKIGPNENNELNKEIWGVLPRYMKVEIIKRHYSNSKRQVSIIAKEVGLDDESGIITKKIQDLQAQLKVESAREINNIEDILDLEKKIASEFKNNLDKYLDKKANKEEVKEIRAKIKAIYKEEPYLAVRRNLVYHYFGNQEPSILHFGKRKNINKLITFAKYIDMLWKHLIKIVKVNIVMRDLPTLMYNIVSNVILAIIQGRNPLTEIKQQISGMINLNRYREDNRKIEQLRLKIAAGNYTINDENQLKIHVLRLNKNPVKPLIDAGLYTSASEDLSNEELHKESYLDSVADKYLGKLPDSVRKTLDILYITKHTPVFHGLLLAMQYSDFAARYSRYYLLINQGMSHQKAIKQVLDNQINYGFSHSKLIQWLNARGLVMFTKFFEGIQRVLKNTTMDKPFNVALAVLSGGFMFENGPFGDSLVSRNIPGMIHFPNDIVGTLVEPPAFYQIGTWNFNS